MPLEKTYQPDVVLDLSGIRCPHLVIATIAAMEKLRPGEILQLTATDLNGPSSISAWARQSNNPLLDMYEEGDHFVFVLKRELLVTP